MQKHVYLRSVYSRSRWQLCTSCLLLFALSALTACQPIQPPATGSEAVVQIPEVIIEVDDDGFTIPADFPGGIIAVTVQNNSANDLDVSFTRLRQGTSVAEVKTLYGDLMSNFDE